MLLSSLSCNNHLLKWSPEIQGMRWLFPFSLWFSTNRSKIPQHPQNSSSFPWDGKGEFVLPGRCTTGKEPLLQAYIGP